MTPRETNGGLVFDGFRLDRRGLFRLGARGYEEPVPLGSRALDLLRLIADNDGEVVSKAAIMAAVWPGIVVEESNLTVQIAAIRRVLDRERTAGSCIQTVPGRGYRFSVEILRVEPAAASPALALPDEPSIAVLPFQNFSGDPAQEYFADGMVEEIITALSRIRWLFVIARNSSFAFRGKDADATQVARRLGVRYLLQGSVRKTESRVRVSGQLIDTTNLRHIWADRFEGALGDIFELQDQVAASVAGAIEPMLRQSEIERAVRKPTESLDAYDLYLRAMAELHRFSFEGSERALVLLRQALASDPGYPAALAELAFALSVRVGNAWTEGDQGEADEGVRLAKTAIASARDDATVLATAGFALWRLNRETEAASGLLDRAVALNPNSALASGCSGYVRACLGDAAVAVERCARAMRLSPYDPLSWVFFQGTAVAHLSQRRLPEALVWLLRYREQHPSGAYLLAHLAATYAHLGRLPDARAVSRELLVKGPRTIAAWRHRFARFRNAADREFLCDGLRLAGLPED